MWIDLTDSKSRPLTVNFANVLHFRPSEQGNGTYITAVVGADTKLVGFSVKEPAARVRKMVTEARQVVD